MLRPWTFSKKILIFFFNFLSNELEIRNKRYKVCGVTNKLPNAKNHMQKKKKKKKKTPSKLRPVIPKSLKKTMHPTTKNPLHKKHFFHILLLCTRFQSPGSNNIFSKPIWSFNNILE